VRILVDTDVLIDLALDRRPHATAAGELLDLLERKRGTGYMAWHTASNFFYLTSAVRGSDDVRAFLVDLTTFIESAPTTTDSLKLAGRLPLRDFEDAMHVAASMACRADVIATRNVRDYSRAPVVASTPSSLLSRLG
jgi:predicted nucleic acid-binding protein